MLGLYVHLIMFQPESLKTSFLIPSEQLTRISGHSDHVPTSFSTPGQFLCAAKMGPHSAPGDLGDGKTGTQLAWGLSRAVSP